MWFTETNNGLISPIDMLPVTGPEAAMTEMHGSIYGNVAGLYGAGIVNPDFEADPEKIAAALGGYLPAKQLTLARANPRALGLADWATVTVTRNTDWFDHVFYQPRPCYKTSVVAGQCGNVQESPKEPLRIPRIASVVPFASYAVVETDPFQGDALEMMDIVGFGALADQIMSDVAEVLYTGKKDGVTIGFSGLPNDHVTQNPSLPAGTTINVDLSAGTPVSVITGITELSKALADVQSTAGVILTPMGVLPYLEGGEQISLVPGTQRWRTIAGDGIIADSRFTGAGPGGVAAAPGTAYLWATSQIDVLLSRPFCLQALEADMTVPGERTFLIAKNGSTIPSAYRVTGSNGVFENKFRADYVQQAAVAMSGCARFCIQVKLA
jgi:hypothetical protein